MTVFSYDKHVKSYSEKGGCKFAQKMRSLRFISINTILYTTLLFGYYAIFESLGLLGKGIITILVTFILLIVCKLSVQTRRIPIGFTFNKQHCYAAFAYICLTIVVFALFLSAMHLYGIRPNPLSWDLFSEPLFFLGAVQSGIGCMVMAFQEELMLRGFYLSYLRPVAALSAMYVAYTGLMILNGMQGLNPFAVMTWFVGGTVYMYMYLKSGTIWLPVLANGLHDLSLHIYMDTDPGMQLLDLSSNRYTIEVFIYELALGISLLAITIAFFGKNGLLTPAERIGQKI
jgi:membrane protease YdiL (CAAX protease family)